MHPALVLQVLLHLLLNRSDVARHIGMSQHHSFGLGGCSRSEDNLERIGRLNLDRTKAFRGMFCNHLRQIGRVDRRDRVRFVPGKHRRPFARTHHQPGSYLRADAPCKIRACAIIDRNRNHATQRASQKGRNPFGAVRSPQQHRVALYDLARFKLPRKLIRNSHNAPVSPALMPVPARKHVGTLVTRTHLAPALEIVQRIQQTCPHTLFSSTIPRTLQD